MRVKSVKKSKRYNKKETIKSNNVEILSDNQINKINSIDNIRDKSIMVLLLNTGLRESELTNLNYTDIFEDVKKKIVKDNVKFIGKGNKERIVPLNNDCKEAIINIDNYNRNELELTQITKNNPLLVSQKKQRLANRTLRHLTDKYINTNPHVFRHTCFTNLRKNGVEGEVIQRIAGHSDYSTTVKYYLNVNNEDMTNAMKTLETKKETKLRLVV